MKLLKVSMVGLLSTTALLLASPGWADTPNAVAPSAPTSGQVSSAPPAAATNQTPAANATNGSATNGSATNGSATNGSVQRDEAMQRRMDNRKAFMDARMAALKAGLQLTPQQEGLWGPVEGAIRDLGKGRHAMRRAAGEATDPIARLKQRGARLIARGQAITKLADASQPLLASLSAEQKARLPILLRGVGHRRILGQAFGTGRDRDAKMDREHEWRHHHRHFADRGFGDRGFRGGDERGYGDDDGFRSRQDRFQGDRSKGDRFRDDRADGDGGGRFGEEAPFQHRHFHDDGDDRT